jgi:hypothetical protein
VHTTYFKSTHYNTRAKILVIRIPILLFHMYGRD